MIIDLSHPIENGMTFFPGDPEPRVAAVAQDPPWQVSELALGSHTGTHVDAARHIVPDGSTIDAYSLERFIVEAIVVPAALGDDAEIGRREVAPYLTALKPGAAVILRTGWDVHWKSSRFERHPYLSRAVAEDLVNCGVALVGTDGLNVDCTPTGATTVHEILLGADVLIVENLAHLDALEAGRMYRCAFVPLRLAGVDGSPVRAFAWTD